MMKKTECLRAATLVVKPPLTVVCNVLFSAYEGTMEVTASGSVDVASRVEALAVK